MSSSRSGRCLCGDISFEAQGKPIAVALCHCSMCRRATGAPMVAWAMFPLEAFAVKTGMPTTNASSPGVERTFCGRCGTQLTWSADFLPGLVDVTVASFDDPESLPPSMHIWDTSRLPWLVIDDALPRHPELPPQP